MAKMATSPVDELEFPLDAERRAFGRFECDSHLPSRCGTAVVADAPLVPVNRPTGTEEDYPPHTARIRKKTPGKKRIPRANLSLLAQVFRRFRDTAAPAAAITAATSDNPRANSRWARRR
ncbi:hypothetical protein GCM10027590_40150 [Nocardiopsis nanhaiensis]